MRIAPIHAFALLLAFTRGAFAQDVGGMGAQAAPVAGRSPIPSARRRR